MLHLKQLLILLPLLPYAAALPTFGAERGLGYAEAGTGDGLGSLDAPVLALEARQDGADGLDNQGLEDVAPLRKRAGGTNKAAGKQKVTTAPAPKSPPPSSSSNAITPLQRSATAPVAPSQPKQQQQQQQAAGPAPLQRTQTAKPDLNKALPMPPFPKNPVALPPMVDTAENSPIPKPLSIPSKKPLPPTPLPGTEGNAPPPPPKGPTGPAQPPQRPPRPTDPNVLLPGGFF
ncbi:hypothetical protein MCOR02_005863 [Pyricularia oryzae]|uniref:Uncharacterized protein n=1 Tax=Pyricularia oryzae TaxID=318829 RepID=A0A4P7NKT5_PYROR|nr:hypothetical protein MCOR02_005863 [Pyricularia oryzae]KAI6347650.1 hypothetical protein MCOR30_000282 [Pyricularia oryzae]KAI6355025.1 hypothetical protein MCOR31_011302 [Pyricularia oryzae]KAI6394453.1 hypothetical protein MCOR20_010549 [Pyricularia oryzae]KAI6435523.1 hypothetical protein MCOR24_000669 [Pyricularia oryzae]